MGWVWRGRMSTERILSSTSTSAGATDPLNVALLQDVKRPIRKAANKFAQTKRAADRERPLLPTPIIPSHLTQISAIRNPRESGSARGCIGSDKTWQKYSARRHSSGWHHNWS